MQSPYVFRLALTRNARLVVAMQEENKKRGSTRKRVSVAYEDVGGADAESARRGVRFEDVARMASLDDNCAVATGMIDGGTVLWFKEEAGKEKRVPILLPNTVLEGHRFAVRLIARGETLTSWQTPFALATRDIAPGEWIRNVRILDALRCRGVPFELPSDSNFMDDGKPFQLSDGASSVCPQVPEIDPALQATFMGYPRGGGRGVGTRNIVVIMGVTNRTASFVRAAATATDLQGEPVVAIAHTEAGGETPPNNFELVRRTLAGFIVHPNVGAIIAVDFGNEVLTCSSLKAFMKDQPNYSNKLASTRVNWFTVSDTIESEIARCVQVAKSFLVDVRGERRQASPASELRIALQCGGSDAFSGISANPLVGSVASMLISHGGAAVQAETDELMGSEAYFLKKVSDSTVAEKFLRMLSKFRHRLNAHGESAEGNPSAGNNYRGLYNIALKSLGAGMKKAPEVRLDDCAEYGELLSGRGRGFYFMDSPGNDLESVAGQVASQCNLIFFTTGNGAITNHPFVPTLKVVTTSGRFNMMPGHFDVDAGQYLSGSKSMETLTKETFDLCLATASGQLSRGELARHSQISIWRNWMCGKQEDPAADAFPSETLGGDRAQPPCPPRPPYVEDVFRKTMFDGFVTSSGTIATDRVALVLPTSLCSSEIARMIARKFTAEGVAKESISRFVALPHSEGCGAVGKSADEIYANILANHIMHNNVVLKLCLEHGCEKHHNSEMINELESRGVETASVGWASVQLDGGIESTVERVRDYFSSAAASLKDPGVASSSLFAGGVAIVAPAGSKMTRAVALLFRRVIRSANFVVIPSNSPFLRSPVILDDLRELGYDLSAQLPFGHSAVPEKRRIVIMNCPTSSWSEIVTGVAASGVQGILGWAADQRGLTGHPFVPTVLVGYEGHPDCDVVLNRLPDEEVRVVASPVWCELLATTTSDVFSRKITCATQRSSMIDFQLARGPTGVSV